MRKLLFAVLMTVLSVGFYACSDDDDNTTLSETTKYTKSDFTGKWCCDKYSIDVYVKFVADGSGEMVDPNGDKEDFTWEITTLESDSLDKTTGTLVDIEVAGLKLTDAEGYFYELIIETKSDTIASLYDADNGISYVKTVVDSNDSSDDDDDDDDDKTDDDETTVKAYEVEALARKWACDAYTIDVYVDLQENGKGTYVDSNGDLDNITWEFAPVEVSTLNETTLEITYSYVAGLKISYSDGYYNEFIIIEENDTIIAIKDNDNNIRYKRVSMEKDEKTIVFSLPGKIEMEDYASGGEGITYHAKTPGGGEAYNRAGGVNILASANASNGFYINPAQEGGEWLNYAVNVTKSGIYAVKVTYSCVWVGSTPMTMTVKANNYSTTTVIEKNSGSFTEYTCTDYIILSSSTDSISVSFSDWANVKLDCIELTQDDVKPQYTVKQFAGAKFTTEDGGYIEFPSSNSQQGSCNMNNDFIQINFRDVFTAISKVYHMGKPAGDYGTHIANFIIADAGSGMSGLGAVFEIVSETELLYLGNINAYQDGIEGQEAYASYNNDPITMTKE